LCHERPGTATCPLSLHDALPIFQSYDDTLGPPSHVRESYLDRVRPCRPLRDRTVAGQGGRAAGILRMGRLVLLHLRFRSIAAHARHRVSIPSSDPARAAAGLSNAHAGRTLVALRSGRVVVWPAAG